MSESDGGESSRRRRRRRATSAQGAPARMPPDTAPVPTPPPVPSAPAAPPPSASPAGRRRPPRDGAERGLRDIVGAGPSQLGVNGALRARDVNRPTDEDLAEADRDVVIVRRNWQPTPPPPPATPNKH